MILIICWVHIWEYIPYKWRAQYVLGIYLINGGLNILRNISNKWWVRYLNKYKWWVKPSGGRENLSCILSLVGGVAQRVQVATMNEQAVEDDVDDEYDNRDYDDHNHDDDEFDDDDVDDEYDNHDYDDHDHDDNEFDDDDVHR